VAGACRFIACLARACRGATTIVLDGQVESSITFGPMEDDRITSQPSWPWIALAAVASTWLLVLFFLKQIIGPLSPDEIYFSHTLWLTLEGKGQFLDFYSEHLPTYFWFYDLIIPRDRGTGLNFVWFVRWSNLAVLTAYVGILFALARKAALLYLPLLLVMVVISRMIEIRSDTLGLLAFNAAWAVLLAGKSRRSLALATMLAILAATFSQRGLVMGLGFGAALAWRSWVARDVRALVLPLVLLACAVVAGVAASLMYPHYFELMVQSTLLSRQASLRLNLGQRLFAFDRLPQTAIAFAAMLLAIGCVLKREQWDRAGLVAIACFTQLLLIFVDPSPYPYVYAWAIVPGLVGLGLAEPLFGIDARKWIGAIGSAAAAIIALAVILYPTITGQAAPVGSNYRLLPDPPLDARSIRHMPLDRLAQLMLSRDRQQSLANQLLVRSELCRRIRGAVLSAWQSHPICALDATYYWFSVKWPNIGVRGSPPRPEDWFETIFTERRPDLFIWGVPGAPVTLNPWAVNLLGGYDVRPGFAIRADLLTEVTGNSDRATTRLRNGRR
jgi:hypothetical protein